MNEQQLFLGAKAKFLIINAARVGTEPQGWKTAEEQMV
jgi:hypothetical protein